MFRHRLLLSITACTLVIDRGAAIAGTIHVPLDQPTIQLGINAASAGDEVIVAPGLWNERIAFNGKAITVRSEDFNDPNLTVINGGAGGTVVTFNAGEGPNSRLLGFRISNGQAPQGGGVFVGTGCSPTIENCFIERHNANNGAGVAVFGSVTLRQCTLTANNATASGGGIFAGSGSSITIHGCRFNANQAPVGASLRIMNSASLINDDIFDSGGGGDAVAIDGAAPVDVVNCTIVNNSFGGVALAGGAVAMTTVANCIIRNNAVQISGPAGMVSVRFSNVQGGIAGPGNIDLTPQFVNPASGDLRLQAASPCIDAGENASVPTGIVEDNNRVVRFADRAATPDTGAGSAPIVDMGAHEFPPPRRYVKANAIGLEHGMSWGSAYTDLQDALAEAAVPGADIDEIWVAAGTYKPDGGSGVRGLSFGMLDDVEIVGGFAGNETLRSQNDPVANQTILSGEIGAAGPADNSYTIVTAIGINSNGKLIGFVIENANANGGAGLEAGGGGAYLENGSPVIRECLFRHNSCSLYGGAIFALNANPNIIRNRFLDNSANTFGGAYAQTGGSSQIVDCLMSGNHANLEGGAISLLNIADADVINCTIVGNTAGGFAGGVDVSAGIGPSSLDMHNCILWSNGGGLGSTQDKQLHTSGGTIAVGHCNILGWTGVLGGVGNSGANPQLVDGDGPDNVYGTDDDNARLLGNSPCIDSGNGLSVPGFVTFDLEGNDRFIDDPVIANTGVGPMPYVDRGAWEYLRTDCRGDIVTNYVVDVADLLAVITSWGVCAAPCPPHCAADIAPAPAGDCLVNVADLLAVITHWGACP